MKKHELPIEHIEKINLAVEKGLGTAHWEFVNLLSGGLTGVPVYKIEVENKSYAIKLENVNDKNFDLVRSYKIIEIASKKNVSPTVYFTDFERGIILMKYIEAKARPEDPLVSIKKLTTAIRNIHEYILFPEWKSVIEILEFFYKKLHHEYTEKNIVKKCMRSIKTMGPVLFDPKDIRSCHCDLNPLNVLFDGDHFLFVDWQAASPQSFYFDLAYCVSFFYFYDETLCASFLTDYLEREPTEEEKAKYYLMRIFTNIYSGIGFITLPLKDKQYFPVLSDEAIEKLPTYLEFMQSIGSGKVNLGDPNVQQQFGFVCLNTAVKLMDHRYFEACNLLTNQGQK